MSHRLLLSWWEMTDEFWKEFLAVCLRCLKWESERVINIEQYALDNISNGSKAKISWFKVKVLFLGQMVKSWVSFSLCISTLALQSGLHNSPHLTVIPRDPFLVWHVFKPLCMFMQFHSCLDDQIVLDAQGFAPQSSFLLFSLKQYVLTC